MANHRYSLNVKKTTPGTHQLEKTRRRLTSDISIDQYQLLAEIFLKPNEFLLKIFSIFFQRNRFFLGEVFLEINLISMKTGFGQSMLFHLRHVHVI